ncbi:MAG TPA: flagellar basal body rod protein FlgB [Azospirillaceae bacterium]|nr:flagellar basal body rod protein FlgB [Azospirillaceae bacterium]
MDLKNLGIFKLMHQKMQWLTQRQEVLAENVANADTPGYKPRDLVPFDFKSAIRDSERNGIALTRTDGEHIAGEGTTTRRTSDWANRSLMERKPYETSPSGNAVVLEEQMTKVAETAMDYQMVTNLYKKHVGLIKTALSRSGGA